MEDKTKHYFFEQLLKQALDIEVVVEDTTSMTGGCINQTIKLETDKGVFLVKYNDSKYLHMFEMERKGLESLLKTQTFRIPKIYKTGLFNKYAFIVMEFVESARRREDFWKILGHQLAEMHLESTQAMYGFDYDNYIGPLNQDNQHNDNWLDFFVYQRLLPQFQLAVQKGLVDSHYIDQVKTLKESLKGVFPEERPSLLHGDLWSGNVIVDDLGEPCLIDPAVYYGHREMELAFTRLFGGFDQTFFESYHQTYPLHKGFFEREEIYNMYPLMVHVNLFGINYFKGVEKTMKLLAS